MIITSYNDLDCLIGGSLLWDIITERGGDADSRGPHSADPRKLCESTFPKKRFGNAGAIECYFQIKY
jgi:hypothetical protein